MAGYFECGVVEVHILLPSPLNRTTTGHWLVIRQNKGKKKGMEEEEGNQQRINVTLIIIIINVKRQPLQTT